MAIITLLLALLFPQIKMTGNGHITGYGQIVQTTLINTPTVNCLATGGCTTVNFSGDANSGFHFAGFADPTIRQDPQTNTLWMAYSWPKTQPGSTQVLDIHLAYSTNNGSTWTYKGVLYQSQALVNPTTNITNYTSHEVMNLYPEVIAGTTYWFGIHSEYWVQPGCANASACQPATQRWMLAVAADNTGTNGPMGLANNPSFQYLGATQNNDSNFPINVNLTNIDTHVANCTRFFEPILNVQGTTLYLMLDCGAFVNYTQFSTPSAQSNAPNWTWSYVSGSVLFATSAQAQTLCKFVGGCGQTLLFTQGDMMLNAAGNKTLFVADLVYFGAGQTKISLGCVATELSTTVPPAFSLNSAGAPIVDAVVKSTDSVTQGPGSCSYFGGAVPGVMIAHKFTNCTGGTSGCSTQGGFYTYITSSGLEP